MILAVSCHPYNIRSHGFFSQSAHMHLHVHVHVHVIYMCFTCTCRCACGCIWEENSGVFTPTYVCTCLSDKQTACTCLSGKQTVSFVGLIRVECFKINIKPPRGYSGSFPKWRTISPCELPRI